MYNSAFLYSLYPISFVREKESAVLLLRQKGSLKADYKCVSVFLAFLLYALCHISMCVTWTPLSHNLEDKLACCNRTRLQGALFI